MIRYPNALEDIEAKISKTWLTKARKRTEVLQLLGWYAEEHTDSKGTLKKLPPFWSDVKDIFVRHQYYKCAYCETLLEGGDRGSVQWDIEHFRPKSNVRPWPSPKSGLIEKYRGRTLGDASSGYHLLAYCYSNYAVVCKSCNNRKSDHFPIAGTRIGAGLTPADYVDEGAYLIHPLGTNGMDPANLITFDGVEAIAKYSEARNKDLWQQANIIVDLFELNRDGLQRMRANWLYHAVWPEVKLSDNGDAEATENLRLAQKEGSPYSGCATCFIELCSSDRPQALEKVTIFKQILEIFE